ncbi:hypothetical protein [Bradyrhizobium sp.]
MSGTGGFQTTVADQPAAFIAGNRTSQNPIFSFDAGPGGLVAGSSLFVGRWAWVTQPLDANGAPTIANSFGDGPPNCFIQLEQQALNTTYLSNAGMQIAPGFQCSGQIAGDFAVVNDGTTEAVYGQKVFAYVASGKSAFAAAGTVFGGASATGSSIAASTFSVTGSVAGNVLTVTVVGSGTLYPGASISGTGIPTAPAPQIVSQLTGTAGGVGTYSLNQGEITAASETISGTYGTLTIGTATGTFAVGDVISGSGVVTGTQITANITGTGGTGGTMVVNNNTVVSSTTITASLAVETKFFARSSGLAGEVVKISSTTDAGAL